jgi:hypothetical protein
LVTREDWLVAKTALRRRGTNADNASEQLNRASMELNVKLGDLAAVLAARHSEHGRPGVRTDRCSAVGNDDAP